MVQKFIIQRVDGTEHEEQNFGVNILSVTEKMTQGRQQPSLKKRKRFLNFRLQNRVKKNENSEESSRTWNSLSATDQFLKIRFP